MTRNARAILWLDGGAGLVAGLVVLALREPVARLYGFPLRWVVFLGVMNLVYASYSGTLAVRAWRGHAPARWAVDALAGSNALWAVVCVVLAFVLGPGARAFGVAHLLLEGAFVAGLAVAEWRRVRPEARSRPYLGKGGGA